MSAERIDAIIADLFSELTDYRGARDAAAPGTGIHDMRQLQADRINYLHAGYSVARPVLAELYAELETAQGARSRHIRNSVEDTARWTKGAVFTGIVGAVMLLLGSRFDAPWWVVALGVVLCVSCAFAVFAALGANYDRPRDDTVSKLAFRIDGIEKLCASCTSEETYDQLTRYLQPAPANQVSRRTL